MNVSPASGTGIWEQSSGHPGRTKHGLPHSAYQGDFDTNMRAGLRLVDLSGFRDGTSARYTTIWEATPEAHLSADAANSLVVPFMQKCTRARQRAFLRRLRAPVRAEPKRRRPDVLHRHCRSQPGGSGGDVFGPQPRRALRHPRRPHGLARRLGRNAGRRAAFPLHSRKVQQAI